MVLTPVDLKTQAVAKAIEARDFAKAMSLRDPEFAESYQSFLITSSLDDLNRLPVEKVRYLFFYRVKLLSHHS